MKYSLDDVESILGHLNEAVGYAKQARHEARKTYDHQGEIRQYLRYASEEISAAQKILANES